MNGNEKMIALLAVLLTAVLLVFLIGALIQNWQMKKVLIDETVKRLDREYEGLKAEEANAVETLTDGLIRALQAAEGIGQKSEGLRKLIEDVRNEIDSARRDGGRTPVDWMEVLGR